MSGALDEFFVRFTDLAERSVDDTGRPELVQSYTIIHTYMYVCVFLRRRLAHTGWLPWIVCYAVPPHRRLVCLCKPVHCLVSDLSWLFCLLGSTCRNMAEEVTGFINSNIDQWKRQYTRAEKERARGMCGDTHPCCLAV